MNEPAATPDRLSHLLERFRVRASLFHTGALCGVQTFDAVPGRGFLHVLRQGELAVRRRAGRARPQELRISEPTLLFFPGAVHHEFINPPAGNDFTCAALDFDGGERNPVVQALPAMILIPLNAVPGLAPALELLFAEADQVRCGSRLLADRLFEVVLIQLLRWIIDHPAQAGVTSGLMQGLSDPRLARALVALHAEPGAAWPLERMAQEAGMSRSAFAAAFKDKIGSSPAQYLSDWRLTLATSLLRAGQPVKRIAADLGYSGPAAFSKAFRQKMGAAPRDWLGAA